MSCKLPFINVEFTDKSDEFFTQGETYKAYDRGGGKFTLEDDDGDDHGMTSHQLKRWFKESD